MSENARDFGRYLAAQKNHAALLTFLVCRVFAALIPRPPEPDVAPSIYTLF